MVRYRLAPIVLLLSCVVSGCVQSYLSNAAVRNIQRVEVISLLGDSFHVTHVDPSGARQAYDTNVADWHVDDDVTEYLRSRLTANGFAARALAIAPKRVEDFYLQPRGMEADYASLCALALAQGADTLVVAARSRNRSVDGLESGYGITERGLFGTQGRYLYAQFIIRVFSTRIHLQKAAGVAESINGEPSGVLAGAQGSEGLTDGERTALKVDIQHEIDRQLQAMHLSPGMHLL